MIDGRSVEAVKLCFKGGLPRCLDSALYLAEGDNSRDRNVQQCSGGYVGEAYGRIELFQRVKCLGIRQTEAFADGVGGIAGVYLMRNDSIICTVFKYQIGRQKNDPVGRDMVEIFKSVQREDKLGIVLKLYLP